MENTQNWLKWLQESGLDRLISNSANRYPKLASSLLVSAIADAAKHSAELYKHLSEAQKQLDAVQAQLNGLWSGGSINPHPYFQSARNAAVAAEIELGNASAVLGRLKSGG